MRAILYILVLYCSVATAQGVLRRDIVLHNGTEMPVSILYPDGKVEATIQPGEERTVVFPASPSPFPLRCDDRVLWYVAPVPPTEFLKPSMFKSRFRAVYCEDRKIYIIPFETEKAARVEAATTTVQPDGWPMVAQRVRSKKAAEPGATDNPGDAK